MEINNIGIVITFSLGLIGGVLGGVYGACLCAGYNGRTWRISMPKVKSRSKDFKFVRILQKPWLRY